MSSDGKLISDPMKFESVMQADVPKGRDGKHKQIITQLLGDIAKLEAGRKWRDLSVSTDFTD